MKIKFKLFIILFFFFANGHAANVTILYDYQIRQSNINDFQTRFSNIFKKHTVIFQQLGFTQRYSFEKKSKDINEKTVKSQEPFCGYDKCEELEKFYDLYSFDRVYVIRGENLCLKTNKNVNLQPISELNKKVLKDNINILIIDMKGYEPDLPPTLSLNTPSLKVTAKSLVKIEANLNFKNNITKKGELIWKINGRKYDNSTDSILTIQIKENSFVNCVWQSDDNLCEVETNLYIEAISCDSKIPCSLNFDNDEAFGVDLENKKNATTHYIYPIHFYNDTNTYYLLLVKQNCIFYEYKIELYDEKDSLINPKQNIENLLAKDQLYKTTNIDLWRSLLKKFKVDTELTPILLTQATIDTKYQSKKLKILIRPYDIEFSPNLLLPYDVFFTPCNPNEYEY
jgi:hypothetical protein